MSVIPYPRDVAPNANCFAFSKGASFAMRGRRRTRITHYFSTLFARTTKFAPDIGIKRGGKGVDFLASSTLGDRTCRLRVAPERVVIGTSSAGNFFCTLRAVHRLLPTSVRNATITRATS